MDKIIANLISSASNSGYVTSEGSVDSCAAATTSSPQRSTASAFSTGFEFKVPHPPKTPDNSTSSTARRTFSSAKTANGQHETASAKYNVLSSRTSVGVTSTSNSSVAFQSLTIAAVAEGRGLAKGEIGLASMDLRHPELLLSQFSDSTAYSRLRVKMQVLNPVEILVPDAALEKGGNMAALVQLLQTDFPTTQISKVHRKHFNDARGLEMLNHLKVAECSSLHKDIADKYYSLACVSALIRYIEFIQNIVFAPQSVKVTYTGVEKTCMIDPVTVKHLELIVSARDQANTAASLFGVLNTTCTGCGARMLRSNLLQPPTDEQLIAMRLDALEELLVKDEAFHNLKSLIARMVDIDQLVTLCVHMSPQSTLKTAEYKLAQIIYLKHTLELVEPLREILSSFQNQLFTLYHDHMLCDNRFKQIIKEIQAVLNEESRCEKGALNMLTQKCFAIKAGLSGLLDVARRTYTELVEDVNAIVQTVSEESGLPFKVSYNAGRGFFLQLFIKKDSQQFQLRLPDTCISVVHQKSGLTCTTRDLLKLNDRIHHSVNEIFLISDTLVSDLLGKIRGRICCLYNLTEALAVLDMLVSLATFCYATDCVRPEFTNSLAIKQGKHPLLERLTSETITANDTYAGPDSSFIIITGPNMAGKSTYLKQVALLQIVAQGGCFVPAAYASFRVAHQIFSRIGHNDDLEGERSAFMVEAGKSTYLKQVALLQIVAQGGCFVPAAYASFRVAHQIFSRIGHNDDLEGERSAFMVEYATLCRPDIQITLIVLSNMSDMTYILQNLTPESLIIIDELGRSTSYEEGMAICHAICEKLILSKALVFFATHFLDLSNLDSLYPNVENFHFPSQTSSTSTSGLEELRLNHALRKGPYKGPLYGFELADVSSMPAKVVRRAKQIAKELHDARKDRNSEDPKVTKERATYRLGQKLLQAAKYSEMDEDQLVQYLMQLKKRYLQEIQPLSTDKMTKQ